MTVLQELAEHPHFVHRLTVDNYHKMLATGVLEEGAPFELLDGQIVRKIRNAHGQGPMTVGTEHTSSVSRLGDLNPRLKRLGCYMRDRGYKQKVYASSAIPMYVILNLLNRTAEVRTKPVKDRYSDTAIIKVGQKLNFPTAKSKKLSVPLKQLLP